MEDKKLSPQFCSLLLDAFVVVWHILDHFHLSKIQFQFYPNTQKNKAQLCVLILRLVKEQKCICVFMS